MFISDFAIKRPVVTVVTMVAIVVFGIAALATLHTDEFPDIANPVVFTAIIYPGASPDIAEREVLEPVEEVIRGISGVKRLMGRATDSYVEIITEFHFEKNVQEASQDIRDAISGIRNDLPPEMEEPIHRRFDPGDFPIVTLALSSPTFTPDELTRMADPRVLRELRSIPGVAQARLVGGVQRELTVQLRPEALTAHGVSVGQVVQALQLQNLAAPVGRVSGTLDERTIRLRGRPAGPEDFAMIVVAERNGRPIRLGELASTIDGHEEPRSLAFFNGQQAIGIEINKAKGYSTTQVTTELGRRVERLQSELPEAVNLTVVRDAGKRVTSSVRSVQQTLVEGVMLTVLVVFLFLNSWRSTVITGLALPISMLASFVAVWAFGFTLNTMSLLGLTLAIGILIDDAIVVRENIVRHVELGKDHYRAAREGTSEIGFAVTATTASIVAVFIPVGFMYGVAGQWFKPMALTLACSVLVSLFVSFSLDPMLSAYWKDPHRAEHEKSWLTRTLDRFNRWFNHQAENYKRVIAWALDHRLAMVVIAVGTFIASFTVPTKGLVALLVALGGVAAMAWVLSRASLRLAARLGGALTLMVVTAVLVYAAPEVRKVGGGFFPLDDRSEFFVKLETAPGSNLEYTRLQAEQASRIARSYPEVEYTYTSIGGQEGNVDEASVYVRLTPKKTRSRDAETIASNFRRETELLGGASTIVYTNDMMAGMRQIQLQVQGAPPAVLSEVAERARREVEQVTGAVDIGLSSKGQKPELNVEIDRGLAGSLGITVGQVAQSLRPAFAGIKTGDWIDPSGKTRDVVVRLAPEYRTRASDLEQLPLVVAGPSGPTTMPLGQIARVRQSTGPAQITHLDGEPVVRVEANVEGRSLQEVTTDIEARLASLDLPPGVRFTQGGEVESQQEVFGRIFFALGIALLLMYLILVLQFGSFVDPLAIMISLPLSLIGVMLALLVAGMTINIMSLIGVLLLAGLVAKNAILLIDFAKVARREHGLDRRTAIIEAGAIRLRPIIMTSMALIAGMVPIALGTGEGAQFRAPLGVAVIGGLITSTLLTLLVIPTVYEILDEGKEWLIERLRRLRGAHDHAVIGPVPEAGD